jgi:hypothetical protein
VRNHFDLDTCSAGQRGDLDRGPRREFTSEILCVNLVHSSEISEVRQKNSAFNHIRESQLLVIENGFHIFEDALGLGLDVARDEIPGCWIQRNLAGAEKQVADAHGMVVRADRRGGLRGFDDLFGGHGFIVIVVCCGGVTKYGDLGQDAPLLAKAKFGKPQMSPFYFGGHI